MMLRPYTGWSAVRSVGTEYRACAIINEIVIPNLIGNLLCLSNRLVYIDIQIPAE